MTERTAPARFALSTEAPTLQPLDGARVLVNVVLNLEHWTLDRSMPRAALPAPHGISVVPDVANHSWVLYGLRAGLPRLAAALAPLGTAVTVALNADVIDHYPQVADLVADCGWEVVAHGLRQQSIQSYDAEEPVIAESIERLTKRFGAPRGWLSPGMNQTDESLTHMKRAGLEFNHDWMIDDRPVWLDTAAGPIVGLPYTLTLNDVTTYVVGQQADGTLLDRTMRTLDRHLTEAESNPVVMPIGLHPHIMGVPHRIAEIEQIVAAITGAPGVRAVTSSQVHDWFVAQVPPPSRLDRTEHMLAEVEPQLRAFTHIDLDAARVAAASATGPLAGLPFAVKEIIDVAGLPITRGSQADADRVPSTDAAAVARLKAAGAVVVGITTSTPYACGTMTVTANPHRATHTPGGSSAGSGAAVGAGIVPVALASQSQASTIRPASYCGAWGYKPTHLRLPRDGMHLLADTLDDLGVITETLDDLERVLPVLADDWSPVSVDRVRVGVVRLDDGGLPSAETLTAFEQFVRRIGGGAVTLVRGTPELTGFDAEIAGSGQTCFDLFAGESATVLAAHIAEGETDPRLAEMVEHAAAIGAEGLSRAHAHRTGLRDRFAALADHVDVLMTLSTTGPAPLGHASTGCRRMPATASLLGVPALSAPWLEVDGLPLGVQLIGFDGGDENLLAVARMLATREREIR